MENNKKNIQLVISVICIVLLILFSVGIVYAFFSYTRIGGRNNVLNTANLTFSFEDSEWIWLENAFPIADSKGITLETGGTTDITEVDGGISKFKVTGGHSSGTIHYYVGLVKEDLTELTKSEHERYSLDPSNKEGQLPDGAININLQSSTSNIFESTGLVNNTSELETSGRTFTPSSGTSYVNVSTANSIADLPLNSDNERVLGTGTMSGSAGTRYFELRMWINDSVHINTDLRNACLLSTSSSDTTTYGRGYCDPSTTGLPEGIKYVYSTGEYSKLYYSTKIKVQTTDITSGIESSSSNGSVQPIVSKITSVNTPKSDASYTNLFRNASESTFAELLMVDSTKNESHPIYYYRGNVTNNNLIFADLCWKIVRTTETGGVKIIYNGTPSGGVCNNTGTSTNISVSSYNMFNSPLAASGFKNGNMLSVDSIGGGSLVDKGSLFYGTDVTYNAGTYTLVNPVSAAVTEETFFFGYNIPNTIYTHHYTCFTNSTSCNSVNYLYGEIIKGSLYYITLNGGTKVEDVVQSALQGSSNTSTALSVLNTWYENHLSEYSDYLDYNSSFCNDRSLSSYGGWLKTNDFSNYSDGITTFSSYQRLPNNPTLSCAKIDNFSTNSSVGNGLLTHPIGLLTADEIIMAGANTDNNNSNFYLYSGAEQWTMTPYISTLNVELFKLSDLGALLPSDTTNQLGIRPVVVLKSEVDIVSGNGTEDNPYIIELQPDYYK